MRRRTIQALVAVALAAMANAAEPVWIDVPQIAQPEEGCGAASLAMVMDYWYGLLPESTMLSPRPDVDAMHRQLYNAERKGVPASRMGPFLERYGFDAYVFFANWEDLKGHIEQGRPVIVAYRTGASTFHYAVAAGIGDDYLAVNDPAGRKLTKISRKEFEQNWQATDHWALLPLPKQTHTAPLGPQAGVPASASDDRSAGSPNSQ